MPTVKTDAAPSSILNLLTLGFATDPVMRWLYPQAESYLENFPQTLRHFGGAAFEAGTALSTEDGHAAALWLPPGAHPDAEALLALFEGALSPAAFQDALRVFEMMDAMPAFKSRELVDKEELEGGKINWKFKVVAGGNVPPAARKVLSEDMLTWYENTLFKPSDHCIEWTIEPIKSKDRLRCHGTWKLIPGRSCGAAPST